MKKNLMSILILALLLVNVILTAITMFSVTSTNNKTAAIVNQIASVLQLDLSTANGEEEETVSVPIEDTQVYDIEDQMTVPLKQGSDGEVHYAVFSISLSMNIKDKGYKSYGENIKEQESLIRGEIIDAFGSYTMEEIYADQEMVKQDIVKRIQELFDSEFVYRVSFRGFLIN